MKKRLPLILKLASILILILAIWAFFYFETSAFLRVLVILLGVIGVIQINQMPETLALANLFLITNDLYNIGYGLAVPFWIIMIVTLGLSVFIFYSNFQLSTGTKFPHQNVLWVYLAIVGLIILEVDIAMSYWPVDPKTKALAITVSFYLIIKAVYLYINNMLFLKRISGYVIVSIFVLAAILILSAFYGM